MENRSLAIEWARGPGEGRIAVTHGQLLGLEVRRGVGRISGDRFVAEEGAPFAVTLRVGAEHLGVGAKATRVSIANASGPCTFFLRDLRPEQPILISCCGLAATEADDPRTYEQILAAVRSRGLVTALQRLELEPEESYERAAQATRALRCPLWLGLGRDMRLFELLLRGPEAIFDAVQPRFHGTLVPRPEAGGAPCRYYFFLGRGWGCEERLARRLDEGVLPILRQELWDGDVLYDCTAFVTLEEHPLTAANVHGTHYLVADAHAYGHMFTPEQQAAVDALLPAELHPPEETVLCYRARAANTAAVPRYAYFKAVWPATTGDWWHKVPYRYDGMRGFGAFPEGDVYAVCRLNGQPLPQEEVAVLLGPGEAATFEFLLPHRPLAAERAERLRALDWAARLQECRAYWQARLREAAEVVLPEPRIAEMVLAGLLHLDLVAYGREPDGPLAATIGVYSPIGSESAPIIQFTDSMGRHDVARRMLAYFLEKQHEDGFMQNFGGYMLETGCVLWSLGEHWRYTRDDAWAAQVAPKVLKACEYLLAWRGRNQREALRGRGYGLLEGKVGDPEDQERIFMLNGYAYLGLSRAAEMLAGVEPERAGALRTAAEGVRADVRTALLEALAAGPAVPLGDGTWCPTSAPWAAYPGPVCLQAEGGAWTTHGTSAARDALAGPVYLLLQEVVDPAEPLAQRLVDASAELFTVRNVGFSQPYYQRQDWAHLQRGEVKAFLKTYYNGLASLADRETYAFWEHYFHASPSKTHEEAWFLMQTRWMLYQEHGSTLRLLSGIPRAWLAEGQTITLRDVASYFGRLSLEVTAALDRGEIGAVVRCPGERRPQRVELRLPHPQGLRATSAVGGAYEAARETVVLEPFSGEARVVLRF